MQLPFVSRERFNDERARAVKAETALVESQNALEEMRQKFLDYIERHRIEPLKISEDTDLGSVQPIGGRPTIANVISYANAGAYKAAASGGESVVKVLERERAKIMDIKRAANGG
jgi:hypothetical protein